MLNRHLPPVAVGHFSMVPRADIPRSTFKSQHSLKTTFGTGFLVPIHVDEVLPGDVHKGEVTVFARVNTLLFPLMDNMQLETFFFFVPARLLWTNWRKFMGEQTNPGDSIAFTIPQATCVAGGVAACTLLDYFGVPGAGQIGAGNVLSVNALPLRAYNLIWNEWFRDENLQNTVTNVVGDGPDAVAGTYVLLRRNKRHDYFTSCLPWPLKGGVDVTLPLGTSATVKPAVVGNSPVRMWGITSGALAPVTRSVATNPGVLQAASAGSAGETMGWDATTNLIADLSTATAATINSIRLAVATQQLLEKDARGGTRYTELLKQHFGVMPEDARLQRPEYIGGGCSVIQTSAIPQTSATGLTGGSTPQGALTAQAVVTANHQFSYHATEHGYIIGLTHVGADLTYQQGLRKLWSRATRYDFYWPTFANLGEQVVNNEEIYCIGAAQDNNPFGYQERWAEYRHFPSMITGLFRSTATGTIDPWHLSQKFTALPTLNTTFIQDTPPLSRALAAGAAADNMQILFDSVFTLRRTRAMPMFSVPGLSRF